jgi:hypothetical protein
MKWISMIALTCTLLVAGACGSDDNSSSTTTGTTATEQGNGDQASGNEGLPQGAEPVTLDPADFTTDIDNPFFPLRPGTRWVSREGKQRVVIRVTNDTKKIEGITARVVRDTVTEKGELVEDTFDWYAQDSHGNVWYMGEDTTEYEHGKPKTKEGSWQAGVDGAEPGVVMPANPRPGLAYRQEYYKGHAEDRAEVISIDATVTVPFRRFENCVKTKDFAPLGGGSVEHKYYARGVGLVLAEGSGGGREELIDFKRG